MDYPTNITTRKSKLVYILYRHLYIFDRGKGFFGRFTATFQELGLLYVIAKVSGFTPTKTFLVVGTGLIISLCYTTGYFYMKYNVDRIESQIATHRNPLMNDLHNNVVKEWGREKL